MWNSFKILVSKNAATWRLHQTTGLSRGIKTIHQSKLYKDIHNW